MKVVTFLTMPLEPESENQGLQVSVLLRKGLASLCPLCSLHLRMACCDQVTYMQNIKAAFLAQDALAVVAALVTEPLSKLPQALPRQEELLLQLVITFLRNLIAVPDQNVTDGAKHRTAASYHRVEVITQNVGCHA